MSSTFTPDPYKVLGVGKDAAPADIRSAYRKLVLKCHPDKVQDEALKAIKQDEFQKVQQAYELLSDDSRRTQYDDQQKLFDLRKEMGRSAPPPGKNVFEYEIRTAEPRSTTFRPKPKESTKAYSIPTKVFMQPSPRSYEDDLASRSYDEPLKARARKTASYEERKRPSFREEEKRKKSDEERDRDRWEKEAKKSSHSASKKSRDKERKKDSESKYSRTAFVVDADDSEEVFRPRMEKKSSRRSDDELRTREAREELARATEKIRQQNEHLLQTDRTRKLVANKDFAAQYMQAARRKVDPELEFRPTPIRRAETFQEPSYTTRYAPASQAYVVEEDLPRRSSARRASEQIPMRSREGPRSSEKERRRSPSYEPVIVDAAPPATRVPLQSHSSTPPRSKTMDYSKNSPVAPPPLPRASTFQSGDNRSKPASRGSKLKNPVEYSDDSDSDSAYGSPRVTTPPRRRDLSPTRYVTGKGRSVPLNSRHRSELRDDDYENRGNRSVSPRSGSRHPYPAERPPLMRSGGSGSFQTFSRPNYGSRMSPEPIIKDVRPKMPGRESSSRSTSSRGPYFAEVHYTPKYGPESVSYTPMDHYRRGSDPTHHRDYAYPSRPSAFT